MTDLVCLEYAPNVDDRRYLTNDGFIYVPNDALPCPFPLCGESLVWEPSATAAVLAGTATVTVEDC